MKVMLVVVVVVEIPEAQTMPECYLGHSQGGTGSSGGCGQVSGCNGMEE